MIGTRFSMIIILNWGKYSFQCTWFEISDTAQGLILALTVNVTSSQMALMKWYHQRTVYAT